MWLHLSFCNLFCGFGFALGVQTKEQFVEEGGIVVLVVVSQRVSCHSRLAFERFFCAVLKLVLWLGQVFLAAGLECHVRMSLCKDDAWSAQ